MFKLIVLAPVAEPDFPAIAKVVNPTGLVAAEVELPVSFVVTKAVVTGFSAAVRAARAVVWPGERGAPANEREAAPTSAA